MSLFHAARRTVAAFAVLAAVSCGDPASPDDTVTKDIEVTNVFAGATGATLSRATFATVQISRVRITVVASPSGTKLFEKTYDVDPSQSKWTLPFTAPLGQTIKIIAELISVTAGQEKVEYSGAAGPLELTPCESNCAPIPVKTYPGSTDNLDVTSVVLSPDAPTVVAGQTTNLTATISPGGHEYTVTWTSLEPNVATVNVAGVVSGVLAGTARITAAVGPKADTVTVTVTPANTCTETPYTVGSTVNGTWAAGDCTFTASGRTYDMYAVTLTQTTAFHAALTGANGRRIQMRRAGTQDYVQVMASEAFMPAAVNPLRAGYLLPAGSYVIEVVTPDAATLGAYTLATTAGLPTGCATVVFAWPGVSYNGTIDNNDCTSPGSTGHEDRFVILPDAGVRLALTSSSAAFGAGIVFRDDREGPASPTLAYDFQSEAANTAKVAYTTTFSGFHEIIVSPWSAASTGAYTMTIGTESATNTCSAIATDFGQRMAKWESTDCALDGRVYDKYTFTTDEQTAIKLSLKSTAGTKSAGVFLNGTEILDWGGSGTGDLNAAWLLPAGTYEVRLGAPAASAGTAYTYAATEPTQIECTNNGTMGGVSFAGLTLGGSDCTFNGAYEDRLMLFVAAGKTIEVTMDGTNFAPRAVIRDPATAAGTTLANQTRTTSGTVTATYTVTTAGYYQVIFTTNAAGVSGTYGGSIVVR